LLFLNAGIVVIKNYEATDTGFGNGNLRLIRAGEESLMIFFASLMSLINARSVQVEDPSFLELYVGFEESDSSGDERLDFELFRPVPERVPLWSKADEN
jgi:hypothetical protein